MAIVRWGADYPDPQDFLGTQLGSSTDNVTGWHTSRFDRIVALADGYNPADPRRTKLLVKAANLAGRKIPIFPLDVPAQTAFLRPDLSGLRLTGLGTLNLDPARAAING